MYVCMYVCAHARVKKKRGTFPSNRTPPEDLTVSSMSVMIWMRDSPYFESVLHFNCWYALICVHIGLL